MKKITALLISLMMILTVIPLSETAYASEDTGEQPIETAADFFQYVYDHELDENGETLGHGVVALDVLHGTTYGGSWLINGTGTEMDGKKFSAYTYIGSDTDATSIENMMKALDILEECNRLRLKDGLPELMVSDLGMAVGMVNANWSAAYFKLTSTLEHAANANGEFQQYGWAENIALGYPSVDSAFGGWYWQEKANYLSQTVTDDKGNKYAPEIGGQTGHYLNIIDSSYVVTGAGYSQNAGAPLYSQEFKYQNTISLPYALPFGGAGVREVGETGELYTVSEYRARLQAAIDDAAEPDTPQLDPNIYHRIAGANRYETAVKVADQMKLTLGRDKFDTIIVANGDNYVDALSGGYLAKIKQAPILLTNDHNEAYVTDYIQENLSDDGTVYLLGGTGVVSQQLEDKLAKDNKVIRLGGADRYGTNMSILKEAGAGDGELLICSASDFADSLSASAVGKPILLVGDTIGKAQIEYIQDSGLSKCYLIGGEGAVSENVEISVSRIVDSVERIGGNNRYETSYYIAEKFFSGTRKEIVIASGNDFPDGLVGGPLGTVTGGPLILVNEHNTALASDYADRSGAEKCFILGGESVISNLTVKKIM